VPGLHNTIKILLGIYILYTCFIALSLFALGMSFFDSLCHSMAALATGGFSPHDASIEYYRLAGAVAFQPQSLADITLFNKEKIQCALSLLEPV
jgi:Trk-type K+ transport system membrane component